MNYRIEKNKIFIKIAQNEFINKSFEKLAESNNIGCAWINGLGAIQNPEVGYYSISKKSYCKNIFSGDYELLSLIGNISMKDGKHFSHTHITFSDTNYRVFGGHLFDAKVTAAGEFIMLPGNKNINREMNANIGLPLWCLEGKVE